MHKDNEGNWVPNYVIKSPRECTSIIVKPEELKYRVLMIHKDKKKLRRTNVLKYIKEGERKGFHERPTCASRERWYDLGEDIRDSISFPERIRKSHIIFYNPERVYLNKNIYGIKPKIKDLSKLIVIALNSTFTYLCVELIARQPGGGGGPLDMDVYDVQGLPFYKEDKILSLKNILFKISILDRKINTIFDELGASSPEEVSLDKVKPDRRELDKIIMGEIIGLTEDEQLEVYRAVIDLVKSRLERAKSVKNNNKTKEGINIKSFVKTVVEQIGDESLGIIYKNKILSISPLTTKILPKVTNKVEIVHEIFGIRIKADKEYIECDSEDEARYLKVFIEAGLNEVKIPEDKQFLNSMLTELEEVKKRNDDIINSYLDSILNKKTRKTLKHQIWSELM